MKSVQDYLNIIKTLECEKLELRSKIKEIDEEIQEERIRYRIESVSRVLEFIRLQYRQGKDIDMDSLLCHCENKIRGNIDGVELTLSSKDLET